MGELSTIWLSDLAFPSFPFSHCFCREYCQTRSKCFQLLGTINHTRPLLLCLDYLASTQFFRINSFQVSLLPITPKQLESLLLNLLDFCILVFCFPFSFVLCFPLWLSNFLYLPKKFCFSRIWTLISTRVLPNAQNQCSFCGHKKHCLETQILIQHSDNPNVMSLFEYLFLLLAEFLAEWKLVS